MKACGILSKNDHNANYVRFTFFIILLRLCKVISPFCVVTCGWVKSSIASFAQGLLLFLASFPFEELSLSFFTSPFN